MGVILEVLEEQFESGPELLPVEPIIEQESEHNCEPAPWSESIMEVESFLIRHPYEEPLESLIESKVDFINTFSPIPPPEQLLPFIEKTKAKRRQRQIKKKEETNLNIKASTEIPKVPNRVFTSFELPFI